MVTHVGLDHVGRYRDTFVADGNGWLIKHRKVSTDWAAPELGDGSAIVRQLTRRDTARVVFAE